MFGHLLPLLALAVICAVHVFAHRLKFLDGTPRSRWLSAAGGISLAYVFLHFMPELAHAQELLGETSVSIPFIEFELYGLALVGLIAYYGMERLVQTHHDLGRAETPDGTGGTDRDTHAHGAFWVHLGSFALYNLIVGYLLVRRGEGGHAEGVAEQGSDPTGLLTFAVAMALHFLVTDYGLREDFRAGYMKVGRWVLCGAVALGWLIGVLVALPELVILSIIAVLGGGVILNVLKEELPAERQSRFGALVAGAAGYAILLGFAH